MIELTQRNYDGFNNEDKAKLNHMARERAAYVHQALFDLHRIQCLYGNATVNKRCKLPRTSYQQLQEEFPHNNILMISNNRLSSGSESNLRRSQCGLEAKYSSVINVLKEDKLQSIAAQQEHRQEQQISLLEEESQLLITNSQHDNETTRPLRITDGEVNVSNSQYRHPSEKERQNETMVNGVKRDKDANENHDSEKENEMRYTHVVVNGYPNEKKNKPLQQENNLQSGNVNYTNQANENFYSNTNDNNNDNSQENGQRSNRGKLPRQSIKNKKSSTATPFTIPVHQPLPLSYETQVMLCEMSHQRRPGYRHDIQSTLSALFSRAHCVSKDEAQKELEFLQPPKQLKENVHHHDDIMYNRKIHHQPWWSSSYLAHPKQHRKAKIDLHKKVSKDFIPRCATQHTASYDSFMFGGNC